MRSKKEEEEQQQQQQQTYTQSDYVCVLCSSSGAHSIDCIHSSVTNAAPNQNETRRDETTERDGKIDRGKDGKNERDREQWSLSVSNHTVCPCRFIK